VATGDGGQLPTRLFVNGQSEVGKKKRMADNSKDNPDAHCLPMGNMQLLTHLLPVGANLILVGASSMLVGANLMLVGGLHRQRARVV
jgi:hypothetical protein